MNRLTTRKADISGAIPPTEFNIFDIKNIETYDKVQDCLDELAEYEDFMEDQGFERLEDLKKAINYIEKAIIERSENKKLKSENQALKDRWNKLQNWIANTKPLRGTNIYFLQETLLEKIQELEKEG